MEYWANISRYSLIVTITFLISLFAVQVSASAEEPCDGTKTFVKKCTGERQSHAPLPYEFVTTTRLYKGGGRKMHIYESCVENHSDRALDVNWFIPKQDGWIPKGCAWQKKRPKTERITLGSLDGCLLYGNLKEKGSATVIAHRDDQDAVDKGNEICSNGRKQKSDEEKDSQDREFKFLDFFKWASSVIIPTDPDNPETTLVEITAHTILKGSQKDKKFNHAMTYYVSPLKGADNAKIENVVFRPNYRPFIEAYTEQYGLKNAVFSLRETEHLSTVVDLSEEPVLDEVGFVLRTRSGQHLGTLSVPAWK